MDALAQPFGVSVHCAPELLWFDLLDGIVNCQFQVCQSVVSSFSYNGLQSCKNPVVQWTQIR